MKYQGFAQGAADKPPGTAITPPKEAFSAAPPGGTSFPVPFGGGHGPLELKNDKPWVLLGDLTITLGNAGDRIAAAPVPPAPAFGATVSLTALNTPEPGTIGMALTGLFGGLGLAGRRYLKRTHQG